MVLLFITIHIFPILFFFIIIIGRMNSLFKVLELPWITQHFPAILKLVDANGHEVEQSTQGEEVRKHGE